MLGVGEDPLGDAGLPCLFDWSALNVIAESTDPGPNWPAHKPARFVVVASQRSLEKIPEARKETWDRCTARSDFELKATPTGWRMAGIIRQLQVQWGDVLLPLGGGAGVEHLSEMYIDEGKPVLPVRADLGALQGDGNGGSRLLFDRALANVSAFIHLRDESGGAAARLSALRLSADTDVRRLSTSALAILEDLRPPTAFYVRLLDTTHAEYHNVENFFRDVVDPVIAHEGFSIRQMGVTRPEFAFMNVEIFEDLHRAGLVVVDLTGMRPNCLMELGYALGRHRRVVITARKGTKLGFDHDKLPTCFWDASKAVATLLDEFSDWMELNGDLPPLVDPRRI